MSIHPSARTDCRGGGRTASGERECLGKFPWQHPCFSGRKSCSDEQRDKEQERARDKRQQNLRNLSEEILEKSQGRRRRENSNANQRKAKRNRARDERLIYNA